MDKPAGVVVHPAPGHAGGTLAQALAAAGAKGGEEDRPGIVHRLDRDTSGLLVVARSQEAYEGLQRLVRRRALTREYLALVVGQPRSRRGTIDAPVGRDRHDRLRHSLDTATPRAAVTHFELEELLPRHALLRVRLETGRTHQIRVHLAAIDLPVAGDPTYGIRGDLGLERQFLHAARLAFAHPGHGRAGRRLVAAAAGSRRSAGTSPAHDSRLSPANLPASRPYSPAAQPWRACLSSREVRLDSAGALPTNESGRSFHVSFH